MCGCTGKCNINSSLLPVGPKGDKGDQGIQGIQGIPGTNGTNGTNGSNGAQGPQGEIGPTGPQGDQGLQGPNGSGITVGGGVSYIYMPPENFQGTGTCTTLTDGTNPCQFTAPMNGNYLVFADTTAIYVSNPTISLSILVNGVEVGTIRRVELATGETQVVAFSEYLTGIMSGDIVSLGGDMYANTANYDRVGITYIKIG